MQYISGTFMRRLEVGSTLDAQRISVDVRDGWWSAEDKRVRPVGVVEVRPDTSAVLSLEGVKPKLGAVPVEANRLGRPKRGPELGPALGEPPVVHHDEVAGALRITKHSGVRVNDEVR